MGLVTVGVGIAQLACMLGWNAAHRMDDRAARRMSVLFCVLIAVFIALIVKAVFL